MRDVQRGLPLIEPSEAGEPGDSEGTADAKEFGRGLLVGKVGLS